MTFLQTLAASLVLATSPQTAPSQDPTVLPDVEVQAAARADMARRFVSRIAAPSRHRGLARWTSVCPIVVNLEPVRAREIATRIAEVADELGIEVGDPGCRGNLVVVFTEDAGPVTRAMTAAHPDVYRASVGPLSRGQDAFQDFLNTDRPVRWWVVSLPVDPRTGDRAVRMRGDPTGVVVDEAVVTVLGCSLSDCLISAAPLIRRESGRLNTPMEEKILTTVVVVDVEQIAGLNTVQLSDYLALVSLAQIDPDAETGGFDTVLNLFDSPETVIGLTAWDEAYLRALYGSRSQRRSPRDQAGAVASLMNRMARGEE